MGFIFVVMLLVGAVLGIVGIVRMVHRQWLSGALLLAAGLVLWFIVLVAFATYMLAY